jgi:hypothetical protein
MVIKIRRLEGFGLRILGASTCFLEVTDRGRDGIDAIGSAPFGLGKRLASTTPATARLEGFEPTTPGSEDRCSCPLSYRRKSKLG